MSDHDPFAPGSAADPNPSTQIERAQTDAAYGEFADARWRAAGATEDDLAELREAHEGRTAAEQAAEGQRVAGASRGVLAAELTALRESGEATAPFGRTVDQVKANVGEDPEAAQAALDLEHARAKPRTTLIEHLEQVISASAE